MDIFQMTQYMSTQVIPSIERHDQPAVRGLTDFSTLNFKQLLQSKINEAILLNQNQTKQFRHRSQTQENTRNDIPQHPYKQLVSTFDKKIPKSSFNTIIKDAAHTFKIDEALIHAVIKTESNYRENAVSHAGAQGLMQLMPQTAKSLGVINSFDPKQNIFGGAKYLRDMLKMFNGDIKLALAAYNAGRGNVKKHGGIPPFNETKQYVQKVLNIYKG